MLQFRHIVVALLTISACQPTGFSDPTRTPTSVELIPAATSVLVGDTEQFFAVVRASSGDVVPSAEVLFFATGGSISPEGVFSAGPSSGQFSVSAAVVGPKDLLDVAPVTIVEPEPPPPASFTPNRPVGMADVATIDFSDPSGIETGVRGSSAGFIDQSAPWSKPGVVRFVYPAGPAAGFFTGTQANNLPVATVKVYIAYNWRVSAGFTMHPANLKVWYFYRNLSQTSGSIVIGLQPGLGANLSTGPFEFNGQPQTAGGPGLMRPNVAAAPSLMRDKWIHTEILAVMNTDPGISDGILKVWVDGVLALNYTNVRFSEGASPLEWRRANLDPYYGGNSPGHTILSEGYLFVDHAVIAASTVR